MAKKKTAATSPEATPARASTRRRVSARAVTFTGAVESYPSPTHAEIANAAYLKYLNRGGQDGRDFDDWVEAERDLQATRAR